MYMQMRMHTCLVYEPYTGGAGGVKRGRLGGEASALCQVEHIQTTLVFNDVFEWDVVYLS